MLRFIFGTLAFILSFCSFVSIGACREIVFVLNASQAMNTYDPFHTAPESIIWGAQNFSDEDEIGIVTFSDDVNIIRPLSKIKDNPVGKFSVEYYGQSDAGAGLLTAIDMLTPKFHTQRDIIFITNGEITSPQSSVNFKSGLEQAKWLKIPVYYINLRYNVDPQNYRSYKDDYVKELPINYNELMTTVRTIIQGDWKTPHIEFPTNTASTGRLSFEVPVDSAERIRISLLSSRVGTGILRNIQPDLEIQGDYIKVFDIKSPTTKNFEITVDFPQGTGLTLDVIPTVRGKLDILGVRRIFLDDYLEITPVYENDPETKIFSNEHFEGKTLPLLINDKEVLGKINDGVIRVPLNDDDEFISLQKINFEDIGIDFDGNYATQIRVPFINYGAWLLTILGLAIICFLSWLIYKKTKLLRIENPHAMFEIDTQKTDSDVKNLPKVVNNDKFTYSGKLMIYVIKTPNGEDISPREFNLFRMNSAQIPLDYILEQCDIDENFKGIPNILINPAKSCIIVENKSDCTITKLNVLIENNRQVELYDNDSINIVTEDATSEIILQYKSLKPN